MKDDRVIFAIRDRDGGMMDHVIGKYARLLWSVADGVLQSVGSEQDVEECVADAFIYLWEHPETFDPQRGKLKSLLCIVARSRAIDRCRQITRRGTVPLEEAVLSEGLGMQDALLKEETRRELLAAVNALEEPNREILLRRYYYEQKPREIAKALGMTVKQIDNSLYRSKQRLRQTLEQKWEVEV